MFSALQDGKFEDLRAQHFKVQDVSFTIQLQTGGLWSPKGDWACLYHVIYIFIACFCFLLKYFNKLASKASCLYLGLTSQVTTNLTQRWITTSMSNGRYYVKPNYLKRWARRDQKRRAMFAEYEQKRGRLRMLSKCDILPSAVRKQAATELAKLPKDSSITRIRNRCVLTDRGRGLVGRFRISRIMFKFYAEKGLIPGVQRSQW